MKRLIIILVGIFLITLQSKSTNIPLDSIKASMLIFLKSIEPIYTVEEGFPNFPITDLKRGRIKEGKEGLFVFGSLTSGARLHYLLVGKNDFQFLNMKEPIDINVSKLLDFLEHNRYSKKEMLFYLRDLIDTYKWNEETIARFNGIIK